MDRINELVHTLVNTAVDDGAIMAVPIAAEVVREFKALESKLLSAEEERERLRTALIEKERECEDLKVDYEYTCELLAGERSRLLSVQLKALELAGWRRVGRPIDNSSPVDVWEHDKTPVPWREDKLIEELFRVVETSSENPVIGFPAETEVEAKRRRSGFFTPTFPSESE